jgi:hypothetical protein
LQKTAKTSAVLGVALLIFGPVIGYVLIIFGFFQTAASVSHSPDLGQTTSRMVTSIIPVLLGMVCGAIGFVLTAFALISHFFAAKRDD